MVNDYTVLEGIVRHSYAAVVWSHKIQEKQADIYSKKFRFIEKLKIVTSAATSAGVFSLIFTDPLCLKITSAIVSFVSAYISFYYKSFDLQRLIASHKTTANKLLAARERYKIILGQIKLHVDSAESIFNEYMKLNDCVVLIYQEAPNTTDEAVAMAKEALRVTKDNSFLCPQESIAGNAPP